MKKYFKLSLLFFILIPGLYSQEVIPGLIQSADTTQADTSFDAEKLQSDSDVIISDTLQNSLSDSLVIVDSLSLNPDSSMVIIDSTIQDIESTMNDLDSLFTESDTTQTESDTLITIIDDTTDSTEAEQLPYLDELPPELLGLDYGYKGYRWGTPANYPPHIRNMRFEDIRESQEQYRLSGYLGQDEVRMTFFYADSGFWKIIIDFKIEQKNMDQQIKQFSRIEKSVAEIYGAPGSINQTITGPGPSGSEALRLKFNRAFYHSSWDIIPARIELVLVSVVQEPGSEFPILGEYSSSLKLIYYNPDFMIRNDDAKEDGVLPSIFDLY